MHLDVPFGHVVQGRRHPCQQFDHVVQQGILGERVGQRLELAIPTDVEGVRLLRLRERVGGQPVGDPVQHQVLPVTAQSLHPQLRRVGVWRQTPPMPVEPGPCFLGHPQAPPHVQRGHEGNARRGEQPGRGRDRIDVRPLVVKNPGHMTEYRNPAPLKPRVYQCTPGTNRTSRLTGRGVRMPRVTARAGRFGLRFADGALVGALDSVGSPRAAAESG